MPKKKADCDKYFPVKGDTYVCNSCGMQLVITEPCTCGPDECPPCLVCCETPMTRNQ